MPRLTLAAVVQRGLEAAEWADRTLEARHIAKAQLYADKLAGFIAAEDAVGLRVWDAWGEADKEAGSPDTAEWWRVVAKQLGL